jgi:hypothetical protein
MGGNIHEGSHESHTVVTHNKMKESEQHYCWGRLVCQVSTGWLSQHSMADRQQKNKPSTRFLVWWSVWEGRMVDRRRVAITKLDAPRLVAGGSVPRLLQLGLMLGREGGWKGTYFQITGFGSARVGRFGRQSVKWRRIKQSVWFVRKLHGAC